MVTLRPCVIKACKMSDNYLPSLDPLQDQSAFLHGSVSMDDQDGD